MHRNRLLAKPLQRLNTNRGDKLSIDKQPDTRPTKKNLTLNLAIAMTLITTFVCSANILE